MSIESNLYSILKADANIKRIVSGRIYPLVMPQNCELPSVTYEPIHGGPVNSFAGGSTLRSERINVHAWATRYDEAADLATKVSTALNAATSLRSLLIADADGYDADALLFNRVMEFSCWGT